MLGRKTFSSPSSIRVSRKRREQTISAAASLSDKKSLGRGVRPLRSGCGVQLWAGWLLGVSCFRLIRLIVTRSFCGFFLVSLPG